MDDNRFDLADFDSFKEDNRREVKKATGGLPHSLWETYSAFANSYGGAIILGVVENPDKTWRTTGLKGASKLLKEFWDLVNDPKKVSVCLLRDEDVKTYTVGEDVIIVVLVPRAERALRPVYINGNLFGGTFKRNHEGDYHCSRLQVKSMLRDQEEITADMMVVSRFGMEAINTESLSRYRNNFRSLKPAHPWAELPNEVFLQQIGAVKTGEDGELHPTGAGLLMFGNEYQIVQEYNEYFLDYREVLTLNTRWTDRVQSQSGDWSGNLYDFFFRVFNKIAQNLKVPFKLDGVFRVDDTPIHEAIREALVNCFTNADFFAPRGIVILLENGILSIQNPGDIRVGKEQMVKGGQSDPRNKGIMKMFNLLDIGERAGSGISKILKAWAEQGWPAPVIEENFDKVERTTLTLPLKGLDAQNDAQNEPQKSLENRIGELIIKNRNITKMDMARLLGVSKPTIERAIRASSKIKYVGSSKGGHWEVLEEVNPDKK